MIIDVHGHIIRKPQHLDAVAASGLVDKVWLLALPELQTSYQAGHDEVIFGTNDEVLAVAKRYPQTFLPFAYLDFREEAEAIDRLHDRGFVGLKAIFAHQPYDDPAYMAHYERATALNMPIMFHLGGLGDVREQDLGPGLSTRAVNMRPSHLGTIAGNFPDLVCIGAHLGQAWHPEVLECMRAHPNVYFDVSGGDTVLVMRWLLANLGEPCVVNKLLVGIDAAYGREQYHADIFEKTRFWCSFFKYASHWFNWADEGRAILSGNARRIHEQLGMIKER